MVAFVGPAEPTWRATQCVRVRSSRAEHAPGTSSSSASPFMAARAAARAARRSCGGAAARARRSACGDGDGAAASRRAAATRSGSAHETDGCVAQLRCIQHPAVALLAPHARRREERVGFAIQRRGGTHPNNAQRSSSCI
jgi:hypothetical protein